jgi:hypothetical protein
MRPVAFSPDSLRKLLLRDKVATLPDLKRVLGTDVDLTVFRKLKELDYLTSYSHGGRFYTLREIARFGADGLWSCAPAWFSRYGTLLATAEAFIGSSVAGYFSEELSAMLHVGAQDCFTPPCPAEEDRPGVDLRPVPLYLRARHSPAAISDSS